jgi:hypothetical protein
MIDNGRLSIINHQSILNSQRLDHTTPGLWPIADKGQDSRTFMLRLRTLDKNPTLVEVLLESQILTAQHTTHKESRGMDGR